MGSPPQDGTNSPPGASSASDPKTLLKILTPLLARVPGTKPFNERMNGRIRDEEASTEKSLSHIPVPKDSLQQEILKSAFVTPHARMKFWRDEVSNWLGVCALILLLAGYVAGPIVARKFFRPR